MKITSTHIPDVKIIDPVIFNDERGFFFESFNQAVFEKAIGRSVFFVQDNHSRSFKGVLRGLHYQTAPEAQGKLVRCAAGEIFDVAVDIRRHSPTFKQWVGVHLTATNKRQLWIPEGFAHGFLTLSEEADVLYKTTTYWAPQHERSILWNDPGLAITWPALDCRIRCSEKDSLAVTLDDTEFFE
ncbi:dTDP-4-dehydrorhamnose 3,5-epimerase [Gulbenkiania mobilis]|uniref:dTDP-4-dehydrorhamnose 3,5-epimerase n=1 Tax=Gulbenkiania mobilis TaxID=397457 RepID=UPI00104B1D86